jgi:hypothetical protein
MILNSPLGIVLGFFLGFSLIAATFFGLNRSRHQQTETSSVSLARRPTPSSIARQVLMTWNSWLSFGFDLIFGVLPALYLMILCGALLSLIPYLDPITRWVTSSAAVLGLITSFAVIYVSLARGNTRHKPVLKNLLMAGVTLALVVPVSLIGLDATGRNDWIGLIVAVETPVVIVAIKHIFMLTRA